MLNVKIFKFIILFVFIANAAFADYDKEFVDLLKSGTVEEIEKVLPDDVNAYNHNGITLLMIAAKNNPSVDVIELLISKGAYVNARNNIGATVLMASVTNPNPDIVRTLIKNNVEVNAFGAFKVTALMLACRMADNPEVVEILLDAGADIKAKDQNGNSVVDYADKNPIIKNAKIYNRLF